MSKTVQTSHNSIRLRTTTNKKKQSAIEKRASSVIIDHMHHWVRKRVWIYLYLLLEYLMLKLYKKLFCRSLLRTVLSWTELYEVQLKIS